VRRTVPPSAEIEEQIDRLLAVGVGENPRESLSELAKLGARLIIQRAIGMDVQIKAVSNAASVRAGRRGEPFDMAASSWYADLPDPLNFLGLLDGRTIAPEGTSTSPTSTSRPTTAASTLRRRSPRRLASERWAGSTLTWRARPRLGRPWRMSAPTTSSPTASAVRSSTRFSG
jgi:hypothetical protein